MASAYALIVGVQKLKAVQSRYMSKSARDGTKVLPGTVSSRAYFAGLLAPGVVSGEYAKIVEFADTNATYANVCLGIIGLANCAREGDLITMMFATHGIANARVRGHRENFLCLYDEELSEWELMTLLKVFAPGVRVQIVFDCCESGSWLDPVNVSDLDERYQTESAWIRLMAALVPASGTPPWLSALVEPLRIRLVEKRLEEDLDLHVFAGTQDDGAVNDQLNFCRILEMFREHWGSLNMAPETLGGRVRGYVADKVRSGDDGWTWWRVAASCSGMSYLTLDENDRFVPFDGAKVQHNAALSAYLPRYQHYGSPKWRRAYYGIPVFRL